MSLPYFGQTLVGAERGLSKLEQAGSENGSCCVEPGRVRAVSKRHSRQRGAAQALLCDAHILTRRETRRPTDTKAEGGWGVDGVRNGWMDGWMDG
eukprot:508683-Pleurochrysis_carterae.AAC.1